MNTPSTLRLILGDQLNSKHTWFTKVDDTVLYVLMEIRSETDYVPHHIQKVMGIFSAMRNFAKDLEAVGHKVKYFCINDADNLQQFDKNCTQLISEYTIQHFEYQLPDEYRVDKHLQAFASSLSITHSVYDTEHFFSTRTELQTFFTGKKTYLMESFYRYMRKKHMVLIDADDKPLHGQWNFDEDNRKKLPKSHQPVAPLLFSNNCTEVAEDIQTSNINTIGSVQAEEFVWPVNRTQALQLLDFFAEECLKYFGTYQDAMAQGEWSIYHSRLSFAMNIKMLSPEEVIAKAIETYAKQPDEIQYNQLEGFVRQIIGWREYMRGIYWARMPEYASLNYFEHKNKLPEWLWDRQNQNELHEASHYPKFGVQLCAPYTTLNDNGQFRLVGGHTPRRGRSVVFGHLYRCL